MSRNCNVDITKMSQYIEHSGIIEHIDGNNIKVQIVQMSACSSCHAKGACSAADMDEKYVEIEADSTGFAAGEMVMVYGRSSVGLLAVLLAFVIPFLLILLFLFILRERIENEAYAGMIALGALVPYFLILSFFNQKLKSKLKFHIRKMSPFVEKSF